MEPIKGGIITFILWNIVAISCFALFNITGLDRLFLISPTYWQWLGIVGIISLLLLINNFPDKTSK